MRRADSARFHTDRVRTLRRREMSGLDQCARAGDFRSARGISQRPVRGGPDSEQLASGTVGRRIRARSPKYSAAGTRGARRRAADQSRGRFRAFLIDVARGELAKLQQEASTNAETVLEAGDVAQVVRRAAEEQDADLVLTGRGVMHQLFRRMRTHVYSIIRDRPAR